MRKNYIILLIIISLAIFSFFFDYPKRIDHLPWRPFRMGLDLQGGTHLVYKIDLSNVAPGDINGTLEGLRDIMERRVNLLGVSEPLVQIERKGNDSRLIVELAGVQDVNQAIKMIGQTPFLEFKEERPKEETEKILKIRKEVEGKKPEEIEQVKDWQLSLEDPYFKDTNLTGRYLKSARMDFDSTTSEPIVLLKFNKEGAEIFYELTKRNVGKRIAIYIDNVLISAPVVREEIPSGEAKISGKFTVQEAKKLAENLSAGALPAPITLISQETVGPTLGKISLEKSLKAGAFGFLLVILFMIFFYRFPGILASIALVLYVIFTVAIFKAISVTLTLAGIAGFILSIGMAVDANVLIFSRMREELREGKSLREAISEGFRRAWPSIRDGNITTLLVALILFSLGSGFVRGFGLTLFLGILVSIFSAVFVTKNFLELFIGTRLEKYKRIWG